MRKLISSFLFLALVSSSAIAAPALVTLTSDKPSYTFGERAILSAVLSSKPDNANMEFDVVGAINGFEVPGSRVSDYQFLTQAPELFPGTFYWVVRAYLQDARLAGQFKATINTFTNRIAAINAQLATETNPTVIAALNAEKAEKQELINAAKAQLSAIRTEVFANYITFTIN